MNYKIKNITPKYEGYEYDSEGYIKFRKNKNGVICIFAKNTIAFGENTIGLCDGSKVRYEDWIELRKHFFLIYNKEKYMDCYCVGGSDSGILMGYSKYTTATQLALIKRGLYNEPVSDETQFTFDYGHINEELAATGFHYRTGMEVVKDSTIFFNVSTGFMQANVDYFCIDRNDNKYVLEIKTCNHNVISLWSDSEVPPSYYSQAVGHYQKTLEDLKLSGTYFCCMHSNKLQELIIRFRERDEFMENMLEQRERLFIEFVQSQQEIPIGAFNEPLEAVQKHLEMLYPKAEEGKTITIDNETIINTAKAYIEKKDQKAALEKEARSLEKPLEQLKTEISAFMEDAECADFKIDGEDYILDMSNKKPRLSMPADCINALKEKYPEVFELFIKNKIIKKTVARNFTIKKAKKKACKNVNETKEVSS